MNVLRWTQSVVVHQIRSECRKRILLIIVVLRVRMNCIYVHVHVHTITILASCMFPRENVLCAYARDILCLMLSFFELELRLRQCLQFVSCCCLLQRTQMRSYHHIAVLQGSVPA